MTAAEFQVGQRVRIVTDDTWLSSYKGEVVRIADGGYYVNVDGDPDLPLWFEAAELQIIEEVVRA